MSKWGSILKVPSTMTPYLVVTLQTNVWPFFNPKLYKGISRFSKPSSCNHCSCFVTGKEVPDFSVVSGWVIKISEFIPPSTFLMRAAGLIVWRNDGWRWEAWWRSLVEQLIRAEAGVGSKIRQVFVLDDDRVMYIEE